jgi:NCAIR mutase (PurE)-related protein
LLYAADLTGGALGAVVAGIVVVPISGIPTALALAGAVAAALLFL